MKRAVATVAIVVLVVSTGCNGVFQERTPPVTREPYDVPDEPTATGTTTPADGAQVVDSDVAPGLASHEVRDAFELAAAHREQLSDRSFDVRRTYVARAQNGSVLWYNSVDATIAANRTRFAVVVEGDRFRPRDTTHRFWSAGDDAPVLHARSVNDTTSYGRTGSEYGGDVPVRDVLLEDPTYHTRLYRIFGAVERAQIAPDDQPEPQSFVVRSESFTDTYLIRGLGRGDVSNVSMTAVVDDSGLVRRLYLGYETRVRGRTVRVLETFEFLDVGETRVEQPLWVDDSPLGGNGTESRDRPSPSEDWRTG